MMLDAVRARFDVLMRKGFVRSVGVLAGGTAFAQALMLLVLPVLTRLYTPRDFSVFAVYASMLGIISVAACLRLEIAIPMPERDEDAANLLALALSSSAIVGGVLALIVWTMPTQLVHLVEQPVIRPYLWLLPLGIWLASTYNALQYWTTRKKKFSAIAKTRMTQAVGGAGTQLGLGWIGVAPFGLLLGHTINSGAGIFGLARDALRHDRQALHSISISRMGRMLREYNRFPKYSTFEALANTAGIQIPVIVIAGTAVGPEAGFLMLATRAMQAPLGLIGGAIAQVFLSQAPQKLRAGALGTFTADVLGGLVRSGVGPLIFAGIAAPPIFSLVFGKDWSRAGELVSWMTPWLVLQFVSSPVSMVMHILNKQRAMLLLVTAGMGLRICAVSFAANYQRSHISEIYAVSSAIFYLALFVCVYRYAGCKESEVRRALLSGWRIIALWAFLGFLMRFAVGIFMS
jgi:O-antigen/teichoic acid export membrane protein